MADPFLFNNPIPRFIERTTPFYGLQMSQIPGFITKPWFLEGLEYGRKGKFSRSGRVINGYNMIIHDLTTNIRYRMLQY